MLRNPNLTVEVEPPDDPLWRKRKEPILPQHFGNSLRAYLDLPISEALASRDPVIRALALVDRRVGAKTLNDSVLSANDHWLVRLFYDRRVKGRSVRDSNPS